MSVVAALPASADDKDIGVKGGSRGLTVECSELQAAGGQLERTAERLGDARDRGVGVCLRLYGLNGTPAMPEAAGRAADAVNTAVLSLRRNIADLEDAATSLRKAGENYSDVERTLGSAFKGVPGLSLVAATGIWATGGLGYPDRSVSEILVPENDGPAIDALLTSLGHGRLRPITVGKVAGTHGKITAPRTAHGLLQRSRILLETESTSHVVEILTIQKDGRDVRVVTLPGTQGDPSMEVGENPFDTFGNAEARAQDSRYVADAVAEALRHAGTSADDAVILVGYSQGGMHAVNTGARLAEDGEFTVEMVLTAGAPAGDRDVPEGVKVLHLEHGMDMVPGLDGVSNPDTPDRITVTGSETVPDGGGPLGPAHELNVYLDMATQADSSSDPSLTEMLGHLARVIGSGRVATRSLYKFSRKPDAKPPARPPIVPISPGNGMPLLTIPGQRPPVLVNPVAPIPVPPAAPPIPVPPAAPILVPPVVPRGG